MTLFEIFLLYIVILNRCKCFDFEEYIDMIFDKKVTNRSDYCIYYIHFEINGVSCNLIG